MNTAVLPFLREFRRQAPHHLAPHKVQVGFVHQRRGIECLAGLTKTTKDVTPFTARE
jgi:hypothetical protein